jgi:hypothetical protein
MFDATTKSANRAGGSSKACRFHFQGLIFGVGAILLMACRVHAETTWHPHNAANLWQDENRLLVASVMQPDSQPPQPDVEPLEPPRTTRSRPSYYRLTRAPAMFGDFPGAGFTGGVFSAFLPFDGGSPDAFVEGPLALGGGARRSKVAENNKAYPTHRVYLNYHHFHNALEFREADPFGTDGSSSSKSIDQFTFGIERPLFHDRLSVELRVPFTAGLDEETPFGSAAIEAGAFGDLALIFKHVIYRTETASLVTGLGFTAPTGADAEFFEQSPGSSERVFVLRNDAWHLMPYLGCLFTPDDRLFIQVFTQLDFPTVGNTFESIAGNSVLNEPAVLFVDTSIGYWLYDRPFRRYLTGVAALVELHTTTPLQEIDVIFPTDVDELSANPRLDVVNATAAIHMRITEMSDLRVGISFPLSTDNASGNRFFDSEIAAQFTRRF